MEVIFSIEDCRTLIWVVTKALAGARVITTNECEQILDEEDEENALKLDKADALLQKRLKKAFGNLEVNDKDLGDAIS